VSTGTRPNVTCIIMEEAQDALEPIDISPLLTSSTVASCRLLRDEFGF
jgi:hypothetical protein